MKKVLWLIVCLMTMVVFSSCSKEDDDIDKLSLNSWTIDGEWYDEEKDMTFFFCNGFAKINGIYYISEPLIEFYLNFENNEIVFTFTDTQDYSAEIAYYEEMVAGIQQELQTARGDRRQQLIDMLNEYMSNVREMQSYQQNRKFTIYGKILSMSLNDFVFKVDDETYKLHRVSTHINF